MKTPKKIGKAIAKKFKNWKGTTTVKETATDCTQGSSTSSSKGFLEEPEKPLKKVLNVETTMEQQTLSPTATTDAAINIETTTAESCENSHAITIEQSITAHPHLNPI